MSEELRTEELLTNEGHTETMADYEDHLTMPIHGTGFGIYGKENDPPC